MGIKSGLGARGLGGFALIVDGWVQFGDVHRQFVTNDSLNLSKLMTLTDCVDVNSFYDCHLQLMAVVIFSELFLTAFKI